MRLGHEMSERPICSHSMRMLPGERYRLGNEDIAEDQFVSIALGLAQRLEW